jgi:hypothetical protein
MPNGGGFGGGPDANSLFDSRGHPLPGMFVLNPKPVAAAN